MRYTRFEKLVIITGSAAILATLALSYTAEPSIIEALSQLLLIGVLIAAVHWGRTGGTWAAIGASVIYIVMRLPLITGTAGLSTDVVLILLTRFAAFGVVGIAGGELCGRIKYIFADLESGSSIDEWTRIYNQSQASRILETIHGQYTRYGTEYSVVVIEASPNLTADLRPSKQRTVLRAVADHIRGDVRLVDEAARLDDGRFLVLLPHTPREGALVAAERIRTGARNVLGAKEESITATVLGCEEDAADMAALRESIRPAADSAQEGSDS